MFSVFNRFFKLVYIKYFLLNNINLLHMYSVSNKMIGSSFWSRKISIVLRWICLVFFLSWMLYSFGNKHQLSYKLEYQNYDVENPRDPSFYNIITEEEALEFESCKDINEAASIDYSKVTLADRLHGTYYVGEVIKAYVVLYDGYGKRKYSGGDQVRATIENGKVHASAPCVVTDNKDGTHTILCETPWSGDSTIFATLAHTRETITSLYSIRTSILSSRNINGGFKNERFWEATICHPDYKKLLKATNYAELCNMTSFNSGMPFYCIKPRNVHLLCEHWMFISYGKHNKLPFTESERTLLNRGQRRIKQHINVAINKPNGSKDILIAKPTIPCSKYNVSLTWHTRQPTGFFYQKTWMSRYCLGFNTTTYMSCLKNRRIYLFGDSTTGQWYSAIMKRFRCKPVTNLVAIRYLDSECYNREFNFHAFSYRHSQPHFIGKQWVPVGPILKSIPHRLDNIPHETNAIVVVHVFLHVVAFHHSVFRLKMEKIRQSIETFLNKSRHSIVMIKGPHTFNEIPGWALDSTDYYGYIFSKILYEVFDGLHDRVVLLNNRDATSALHTHNIHPPDTIVNAMLDQMLNHACK